MMDEVVKSFIEDSIDVIEQNKWFMLFMGWYTNPHKQFPDTQQFEELIDALKVIDRDILEHTENYRKAVIITITRGTIADIRKNLDIWTRDDRVSLNFLLMDLYSTLGLKENDVIDCIMEAAESEGLTYDATTEEFKGLKL